jgi:mRNA-degrading endonuclease RelE of RelBE toxin-antitoxin system
MTWVVKRTDTFLVSLKAIRKNKEVLTELDKKQLQGKKSTRIAKRYRLIFTPDEMQKVVYLNWIDHREHVY